MKWDFAEPWKGDSYLYSEVESPSYSTYPDSLHYTLYCAQYMLYGVPFTLCVVYC